LSDFLLKEGLLITKIPGDLLNETFCADLVYQANRTLGGLDLVVNNAGYVFLEDCANDADLVPAQLRRPYVWT
jgi:NAD(P)-dependent dehydrogenase (short-subunit alcohol dehydrogenase family)